jgi:hypothetical protein
MPAGIVDGFDLGVGQSVFVPFPAVSAAAHDLVSPDDDTAHGNFAFVEGLPGQSQGLLHIENIVHGNPSFVGLSYPMEGGIVKDL